MLLPRQQPTVAATGRKSKGSSQWATHEYGQLTLRSRKSGEMKGRLLAVMGNDLNRPIFIPLF